MVINTHAKGYRAENEVVKELRAWGIQADRIPLSGQHAHRGDVEIRIDNYRKLEGEVKSVSINLHTYDLLKHSSVLFKRTCRKGVPSRPFLATMYLSTFATLLIRHKRKIKQIFTDLDNQLADKDPHDFINKYEIYRDDVLKGLAVRKLVE